ncbi:hypothetical protein D9M70_483960 [compost metagenome]
MEVDPDDGDTRVELTEGIEVVTDTNLLLLSLMTAIPSLTPIPLLTSQLTDPCYQDVHAVMVIEVGRPLLIQTDRATRMALQRNVLTGFSERLQVLAAAVINTIIKQIDHLLDVSEVLAEPGVFDALVTRTSLLDSVCR